jgi:hypothetical protein
MTKKKEKKERKNYSWKKNEYFFEKKNSNLVIPRPP